MKTEMLQKLSNVKENISKEGFTILGVFGSVARGEETEKSDIDILYRIENIENYLAQYSGWNSITHISDVKASIEKQLGAPVDFVDIESLNETGKKYILKELVHV